MAYNYFTTKINDITTKNNRTITKFQTPNQINSAPNLIYLPPKIMIEHQNKYKKTHQNAGININ
jgi:hypothetical protein